MEVVYVAIGESFRQEAAASAFSLKKFSSGAKISLYTDSDVANDIFDNVIDISDLQKENPHRFSRIAKAHAILNASSDSVLYLDTDTLVCSSLDSLFSIPEVYEMAAVHDTWRHFEIYQELHPEMELTPPPEWVPFYNGGVLFVRKTPKMIDFLNRWSDGIAADQRIIRDQLVLRSLVQEMSPRILTLPGEYNVRAGEIVHISGLVKILHYRSSPEKLHALAAFLNSDYRNRIYVSPEEKMLVQGLGEFKVVAFDSDSSCVNAG